MSNLSEEKRQRIGEFINTLREANTSDHSILAALNEIENEINSKKYGISWELHSEEVDDLMKNKIPVFTEVKSKELIKSDDEQFNFILEGDNLHSLYLLEKTHKHAFDVIYIDPPYNTGATDWTYNNAFVDENDTYKHSKWLSFMYRRLEIAKRLLTTEGIMVVAIDDYEYSHLYMLLEDIFYNYNLYTVIVNHHPQGGADKQISRTHEYAIFVVPKIKEKGKTTDKILLHGEREEGSDEYWSLMRGGRDVRNLRIGRPNSFYAILVDPHTRKVMGVGPSLAVDESYETTPTEEGYLRMYPIGSGVERVWRYERSSMKNHIKNGDIICTKRFAFKVRKNKDIKYRKMNSLWLDSKYNAGTNGTTLLSDILNDDASFAYPKSLYTVKDTIKYLTYNNKNALVLDFFAGSGTTGHAVLELNNEDDGNRHYVLCTNNENEICSKVTYPRNKTVITGKRPNKSNYSEETLETEILYSKAITLSVLKDSRQIWKESKDVIKENKDSYDDVKAVYENDTLKVIGINHNTYCGIPSNLKYYKTDFISKSCENITDELLKHVGEMVQLEHGIKLDNKKYLMLLSDDDADQLENDWDNYKELKAIYISKNVLLTTTQKKLFAKIEQNIIPDYYFNPELREVGETW